MRIKIIIIVEPNWNATTIEIKRRRSKAICVGSAIIARLLSIAATRSRRQITNRLSSACQCAELRRCLVSCRALD